MPAPPACCRAVPLNRTMAQPGVTDDFFRGFDNAYPDLWRFNEWKREFDQYVATKRQSSHHGDGPLQP